ncbi:RING finger domain-containing protein, partial [Endozoicomonas sp. SESOKO4]|uniref:RING finger domain-containing protein n=1 Tax=Endozoicomonas sp. SESOKO4 TaxID=2828745 RepID=UPI00214906A6
TKGNPVTPLEAALDLQRSFYENSKRNRFIKQLIEATTDKTRTLNDPDKLSALRPIIPPDRPLPKAGDNNLDILYKIVQDIIHRVNQSDQQPPIGQFEKYCFIEYFVQLFLFYSNPLELIRHLLGQISDSAVTHEIIIAAQSLKSASSFSNTFMQFHQHPSFHELQHFLNEGLIQLHTDPSPREPEISSTGQVHSFDSASGSGYSQQGARPKRRAHNHQPNVLRQKGLKTRQSCDNHQTRLGSTPSFTRAGRAIAVPARKTMDDYMNINAFRDNAFKVDKVKHAQITDNECPICRKHFSRTARLVKTPCNHIFHVLCLNLWLQRELPHLSVLTCPVCRSELNNLKEKLNNLNKLLKKYGNCHSLDSANRAVKEWNTTETGYEALYHFVQLCRHNSKVSDDSRYVNILRKIIHPITKANIPHDLRINSATFSPDSRRVVTASNDCTAKIYGHKADGSWEEEVTIRHNGTVKSASFSSDNCRLITASTDHKAKIFSQEDDGSWTKKLTVQHTGKVNSATFSTDSHHIVTASEDGTAKIFAQKDDRPWEKEATISHNGPIQSATFSSDDRHVVTVGKDNVVKITGRSANGSWKIKATISHDDAINSATFSPDARRVVTASEDCTAIIYAQQDDGSWEKEFTISHIDSDGPIQSARFSPDDRHVMTVGRDDLVKIYGKQDNGRWLKKAIIAHEDRINSATFSADGCHLVTASDDNTAKIYGEKTDASWEEEITVYHYHKVLSATFSPDSRHMVTTSIDRAAKIHSHNDNGSWKEDTTTLHRDWVCFCSATFSTDGRFVVTFTMDRKAKIHTLKDDASWKKEITICHDGTVLSASFSADSRFLVTTNFMSDDGRFYHTAKITELWKEE